MVKNRTFWIYWHGVAVFHLMVISGNGCLILTWGLVVVLHVITKRDSVLQKSPCKIHTYVTAIYIIPQAQVPEKGACQICGRFD